MLEQFLTWVLHFVSDAGYPGLAIAMFLEGIFLPLPSEIILPLAGSLTRTSRLTLFGITLVGTIASVSGASIFYQVGYWIGEKRLRIVYRKYCKWLLLSEDDLDRAILWFKRRGEWIILPARLLPGFRILISIPAGLAHMNRLRFTIYTALGTACWNFLLAYAGRLLGNHWEVIDQVLFEYDRIVVALIFLGGAGMIFNRLWKRSKSGNIS